MTVETPKIEKKKVTWRDFSFDEHMESHVRSIPGFKISGSRIVSKKISKNTFRVNVYDPAKNSIARSCVVKAVETPEGYIFETLEVDSGVTCKDWDAARW